MLFNPKASAGTKKNQVCEVVKRLRAAGLLETMKLRRKLFARTSDLGARVLGFRESTTVKAETSGMCHHDVTETSTLGNTVIDSRDDRALTYIDEQETREKESIDQKTISNFTLRKSVAPQVHSLASQAQEIYEAYPRKVAGPKAIKEIQRTLRKFPFAFVLERTKLYASICNCPPQYIPYPANFFRDERFNDDPQTWRRQDPPTLSGKPELNRSDQFGRGVGKL